MLFSSQLVVKVIYCGGESPLFMGRLTIKDRKMFFEYAADFLESGLHVSPLKLPLRPGLLSCTDSPFEGLFGVFNDSLPDGWGRLLLDRKLMSAGLSPIELTPLDRLRVVGAHGMGAFVYEPEIFNQSTVASLVVLDQIADECRQIESNEGEDFIDELYSMNGSSGGARPKVMLQIQDKSSRNVEDWIVKFHSSVDPFDMAAIEYAYHLMAVEAGLRVPEAQIFPSKTGPGYFGVKRFDRQSEQRVHMHTAAGLLHADYRLPSLDYETLLRATLWLTKDVQECEEQFRQAVFNVLAHNRDDHAKNFSYLMSSEGIWTVSPAYDLTFSSGPAGGHSTSVMGEGKTPGVSNLLKLADSVSMKRQLALQIIDRTKEAVSRWSFFAKNAGVREVSSRRIEMSISKILTF